MISWSTGDRSIIDRSRSFQSTFLSSGRNRSALDRRYGPLLETELLGPPLLRLHFWLAGFPNLAPRFRLGFSLHLVLGFGTSYTGLLPAHGQTVLLYVATYVPIPRDPIIGFGCLLQSLSYLAEYTEVGEAIPLDHAPFNRAGRLAIYRAGSKNQLRHPILPRGQVSVNVFMPCGWQIDCSIDRRIAKLFSS